MSPLDVVTIDFRKYPDAPHWRFSMYYVGEDDHGTWLWAPAGSKAQRGDEPAVSTRHEHVKVITRGDWWTAIFTTASAEERREELYVDIATPAEWEENVVRMIDLDLDIGRWPDGSVEVLDEDEFAEHQTSLGYPDQMVDKARTTTARLYLDVVNRKEPFDQAGAEWMQRGAALGGSPL